MPLFYTATGAEGSAGLGIFLPLILMLAMLYFLMIRPESKRKKQAEEMRSSLKKGDQITTIGGIVGKIVQVTDENIVIETSDDRVRRQEGKEDRRRGAPLHRGGRRREQIIAPVQPNNRTSQTIY